MPEQRGVESDKQRSGARAARSGNTGKRLAFDHVHVCKKVVLGAVEKQLL
jgi:hypothetical protein